MLKALLKLQTVLEEDNGKGSANHIPIFMINSFILQTRGSFTVIFTCASSIFYSYFFSGMQSRYFSESVLDS